MSEAAAIPDPDAWWTPEQCTTVMLSIAVDAARSWGELTFLRVEGVLASLPFDDRGELRSWVLGVADDTALNLIANSEEIIADLGVTPDQRRQFIADRVGVYRLRLVELISTGHRRGEA